MSTCPLCGEQEGATAARDELREKVARLEKFVDDLWAYRADLRLREVRNAIDIGLLTRERDNLRAALEKYGRHTAACDIGFGPCDCGLTEALKGAEEAQG